jgi:hypothetical protein
MSGSTAERRKVAALAVFVLDVLVCGIWAYWEAASIIRQMYGTGSGGFAGGSLGLLELLSTIVPPLVTIWLARLSAFQRLARRWRNIHLAVTLALIIVPMMTGLAVLLVSIVVFMPVQVFFVVGAMAIWIASPRTQPRTSTEASS